MSYSPSSSSSMKKKTPKFLQIKPFLFKKPVSSSSLTKRLQTIFNKASELSILCDIEVCVICYGPDGKLNTGPQDREKVKKLALRYSKLSEEKRSKASVNLRQFLKKINKEDSTKSSINHNCNDFMNKNSELGSNFPDCDSIEGYSEEQLTELRQSLEFDHSRIQQRVRSVVEAQRQRNIQNKNMPYQARDTMNHLQQHSNQIPMHPFNYGNNILSQTLDTSSVFNQTQSLAPIPSHLMIYPNEINQFQNANMCSFNNINEEDYSSSLGVQVTDMNGLQNMNMYGYNNNGLSNQLVQFPTQTAAAASGFQFGSIYTNY